ncbi:hypothetical protein DNTS_030210 [Danionella cerebrum]|uniref:RPA-related protein RADX-like n=1 Tax=Danionella cerebrum TaxID=2873325 RepID=A0A553Q894_9TELE|nr:hypothetical protein DNTS_030210 [Danionella translucida]
MMATPASMTESGSGSVLQTVFEQLAAGHSLSVTLGSPLCVAVVSLERYLSSHHPVTESYSYDVMLTDGRWRVKCQLADNLSRWVRRGSLRCGSGLLVSRLSMVHDETRLNQCFLRIDGIQNVVELPESLLAIKQPESIPDLRKDHLALSHGPLQQSRKYYLPLWINDDPYGNLWIPNSPPPEVVVDVSRVTPIAGLECVLHISKQCLPLLVRVLHRSRIRYYGKHGQSIDFPYQVYCEVADQSGIASLVVWNDLCLEWFHRLTVGSVLYLQQYSVKKMTVIPPKSVLPQWGLPDVPYNFATRSEVNSLNSSNACDVIGLVTYVGRVERLRSKEKMATGPEKFWAYRWVHAVDGTTESPFILEVFSSSQPEIFNNICPMTFLVCTQMRVCRTGSSVHLTSSTETQIFITGFHKKQPYIKEPKVKAFIQWTKTLKESVVLSSTAVGGHYTYPPAPSTFSPSTAVADLKEKLERLQYRECRRVAVQGYVSAVQYHPWPPLPQTDGDQDCPSESVQHENPLSLQRRGCSDAAALPPSSADSDIPVSPKRQRVDAGSGVAATSHGGEEGERHAEESRSEEQLVSSGGKEAGVASKPPSASWESSMWAAAKEQLSDHLFCGSLDPESVPERFSFDDRDVHLHRLNLSPSSWSPELSSQELSHAPVACCGYFTLSLLGLNRTAAVDVLFVPLISSDDPRAAGVTPSPHDNSLISCLSSGRVCTQPDGSHPSLGSLMSSAPPLESERVVCLLDLCLLGEQRLEMICSKLYRAADICQPENIG